MKILFVSNKSPYFLNTNHYRVRALEALGHAVTFFDVRSSMFPARLRAWLPPLETLETARINRELVRACTHGKFGFCLVVGGEKISADTVKAIRSQGVAAVLWTSDAPQAGRFDRIAAAAGQYGHVFCAGSEAVDILEKIPGCQPIWLPFACDPACHHPQAVTADEEVKYRRDISFVGSWYPHRADVLDVLSDLDVGIWGPLWGRLPESSPLKHKAVEARLGFDVWTRIYTASKIVVVVHYQDGVTPCYQASPKLFEAMACGAFILCDDQKDARRLFNDGEHVVFFKDKEDLKAKAVYYLQQPQQRARIAAAGQQEVLGKHTYAHRLNGIMKAVMA